MPAFGRTDRMPSDADGLDATAQKRPCLILGDFEKSTENRRSASYPQVLKVRKIGVCGACWIFCAS